VVEFEHVEALTVDALVAMGLHGHPLLTSGRVARSTGGVRRSAFGVVDQKANEGLVQLAENGVVSCGSAVARLPTSL
jgi:hypothetical protein